MTPSRPDIVTVQRRLRLMRDALDHLGSLAGTSAEDLDGDPLTRAAAERLLQVVIDLALDINGHLVVALRDRAPETGRQSFIELATCDVISEALAERLAPSAGLRNVLVHQYVDIRTDLVASSIASTLEQYPAYIEAVAGFLKLLGDTCQGHQP